MIKPIYITRTPFGKLNFSNSQSNILKKKALHHNKQLIHLSGPPPQPTQFENWIRACNDNHIDHYLSLVFTVSLLKKTHLKL